MFYKGHFYKGPLLSLVEPQSGTQDHMLTLLSLEQKEFQTLSIPDVASVPDNAETIKL